MEALRKARWVLVIGGIMASLVIGILVCVLLLLQRSRSEFLGRQVPLKLIMDVDAGADDAMAILEAVSMPGVDLIAITCVHGNTNLTNVVKNVLKTLDTAGKLSVPLYAGASESLMVTPPYDHYFGNDGFGDFDYPNPPDPDQYLQKEFAVDALVRLVSEQPGEITLLCIGSLTNAAMAIRKDPNFISNLKQLVILGGSTEGVGNIKPGIEFNFYMDPEADFIVFNGTNTKDNKTNPILLVPWETIQIRNEVAMDWRLNVLGKINSSKMNLMNNAERLVLDPSLQNWASGDPLAAAVLLQPELVWSSARYFVVAETEGNFARGALFVDYNDVTGNPPNAVIVHEIDVEAYKNFLIATLS